MPLTINNNGPMPLRERCIIQNGFDVGFLWSRLIGGSYGEPLAQVHDGAEIIADVTSNVTGKRSLGTYIVKVYAPRENGGRKAAETRHSTLALAVAKMDRAAIAEFRRRRGE